MELNEKELLETLSDNQFINMQLNQDEDQHSLFAAKRKKKDEEDDDVEDEEDDFYEEEEEEEENPFEIEPSEEDLIEDDITRRRR